MSRPQCACSATAAESYQCLYLYGAPPVRICGYLNQKGSDVLAVKRSAGIAPEVNNNNNRLFLLLFYNDSWAFATYRCITT